MIQKDTHEPQHLRVLKRDIRTDQSCIQRNKQVFHPVVQQNRGCQAKIELWSSQLITNNYKSHDGSSPLEAQTVDVHGYSHTAWRPMESESHS
jgi:hypothetical protein